MSLHVLTNMDIYRLFEPDWIVSDEYTWTYTGYLNIDKTTYHAMELLRRMIDVYFICIIILI